MWRPFAKWVVRTYPADAAVMYYNYPKTDWAHETPRSFELWRQHVQDYVEAKAPSGLRGTARRDRRLDRWSLSPVRKRPDRVAVLPWK